MGNFLTSLKEYIGGGRGRLQQIRADLKKARDRVKELQTLPLPAEEVADLAMAIMDRHARTFEEYVDRQTAGLVRRPMAGADDPAYRNTKMVAASGNSEGGLEFAVAYYLRSHLREGFLQSARRQCQKSGPPRAARVKELARLAEEIARLESEERAITEEFVAARNEINA